MTLDPQTQTPAATPWSAPSAPTQDSQTSVPSTGPRRPGWWGVVGVAVAAALVSSAATAGTVLALGGSSTSNAQASIASIGTSPKTSKTVPVSGSTSDNPDWQAVAEAVQPSVVAITVQMSRGTAEGSGVIADSAGHILTNNHVVGDAVESGVSVTLSDGTVHDATTVGTDPTTDLAVIKLTDPPKDLVPAVIGDSGSVEVGQAVMAVGNPLGLSSTVTTGIVSSLDRPVSTSDGGAPVVTNAIQIDAAINPGNSGGPLFNASGEVIGITSSIASLSSSSGSIGLGFAIPSNLADRIGAELIKTGTADHAFLGVTLSDGTATADGVTRMGAVVESVRADTPAAAAGLEPADVVVAIDNQPTAGAESLTAHVRELAAGQSATLTVVRDGVTKSVDVTFAALDAAALQHPDQHSSVPGPPKGPRG